MISDYFFMHRIIRETINKMIINIKKEIGYRETNEIKKKNNLMMTTDQIKHMTA